MRSLRIVLWITAILLITHVSVATDGASEPAEGIVGVWRTEKGGGKIQMFRCGDAFCGKTVWISKESNPAGMDARDPKNPDPKKRNRKLVGTTIFWNLKWDAADEEWKGGFVYDPTRGDVFRCKAWLENGGRSLKVRGYLGISLLGSTTTWTRAER